MPRNVYREAAEVDPVTEPEKLAVGGGFLKRETSKGQHACVRPGALLRWWYGVKCNDIWTCGRCGEEWRWMNFEWSAFSKAWAVAITGPEWRRETWVQARCKEQRDAKKET